MEFRPRKFTQNSFVYTIFAMACVYKALYPEFGAYYVLQN